MEKNFYQECYEILEAAAAAIEIDNDDDKALDIINGYRLYKADYPGVTIENVCSGDAVNLYKGIF